MKSMAATPATLKRKECQEKFLAKLCEAGNVREACKAATINRTTAYRWRYKYKDFAKRWAVALEDACDILVAKAWSRATKDDSDRVLMFLLKAHRKGVYGEKVDVTSGGEVLQTNVIVLPAKVDGT